MNYAVVLEPVPTSEDCPGMFYAHIPTLGLTTHGLGIEGAMAAAKDLVTLWIEEKQQNGEPVAGGCGAVVATLEVG